tara:strand:+ start:401 stop:658 length:258 start_codon:yes stop_codon:yes gene_type:complete
MLFSKKLFTKVPESYTFVIGKSNYLGEGMSNIKITEEMQFDFDERAAIMEVDGNQVRIQAEWKALYWMRKVYGLKFDLIDFRRKK